MIFKQKSEKSLFVLSPGWIFWIYSNSNIPYILFKLEEIKKREAISADEHTLKAVYVSMALTLFSLFLIKSIGILTLFKRIIFVILQT